MVSLCAQLGTLDEVTRCSRWSFGKQISAVVRNPLCICILPPCPISPQPHGFGFRASVRPRQPPSWGNKTSLRVGEVRKFPSNRIRFGSSYGHIVSSNYRVSVPERFHFPSATNLSRFRVYPTVVGRGYPPSVISHSRPTNNDISL